MTTEMTGYQAVLDASVAGIIVIDAAGTVHTFGRGAEKMFGYSADEVIGRNVSMLMPSPDSEAHDDHLQQFARTGEAHIIGVGRDLEARHADGSLFGITLSVGETVIDDDPMFIGVIVDRRERDEARYWLDEFFDLTLELLAVATFDGRFMRLNPAWESTFGYPVSELVARPFMDFVHPDDAEATAAVMQGLVRGRQVINFENRYRAADGTYRWLEWSAKPMVERGLIMAVAHDVSRRREDEEQLRVARDEADRASRAKSEFLSRMSHELRTPLNSVLGFAQLLGMDDLSERQRDHVTLIQRSGRHLLELIDEVLDIARIEAGKLRMSLEPVSIADELKVALDLIGPLAADRGLSMRSGSDAEGLFALADRQRLLQVLLNLLSNAVKYNRPGGSIAVACEASAGTVSIAVTDTGIGINEANVASLFTPFERLGAEDSPVEGTGVGLALSKALTEQMGGALTVSSTPGVGSTFCLELPHVERGERTERAPEAATPTAAVTDRPLTVLYIEDNVANSRLMERALQTQGNIELVTAAQGSLALDLAPQLHPDLILLDLHLPDMPGEEVLQRLRATPALRDSVIVVCSADASPGQSTRLISGGASGYLTKPIDLNELFDVIGRVRAGRPLGNPQPGGPGPDRHL